MDASSSTEYRPHRTTSINSSSSTTTATSELFICFTSRLSSSSSMKISSNSNSKSILSPGRSRDSSQQISLSSSLSRRLRTNGSLKGGQASPMFPSGGKKRYDNPEPSSPKVTCIGQVRVKTKKKQQAKKLRNGSQRKGEVSFRKLELSRSGHHSFQQQQHLGNTPEGHRNQRWVHFPVTICEALRTFGADWNCFLPCRSSCMSSKEDKAGSSGGGGSGSGGSSCGAVIARWLVAVQDDEGNGRREIELVVGGEEMDDRSYRSQRRHIFDGLDFSEEKKEAAADKEDEGGRVSISIPPKNALLLMRCRSDPVKMAALANRFCERSDEHNEKYGEGDAEEVTGVVVEEEVKFEQDMEELKDEESEEQQKILEEAESSIMVEEEEVYEEVNVNDHDHHDLEPESDEKMKEEEEDDGEDEEELELLCGFLFRDAEEDEFVDANGDDEDDDGSESAEMDEAPELDESVNWEAEEDAEKPLEADTRPETAQNLEPDEGDPNRKPKVREREDSRLPECLLLMMCEPKLSMEVSKETWVCSTDFIRWLPERHSNKAAPHGGVEEEPVKKRNSTDRRPRATGLTAHQTRILQQPPRNSVSFPAQAMVAARRSSVGSGDGCGESMAAVIEKKLRSAKAGEPLALTRCKSEPMRSAIKLAAPDSCFWKNRKLEPHRPPRVNAAGVGF